MNVTTQRVIALVISVFTALPGALAASEPGGSLKYLNNNRWTQEERKTFYHTSEGPFYMPHNWLKALEAPNSKADAIKLFGTAETFRRYGLIVDPSTNPPDPLTNPSDGLPDGLPVGFVISKKPHPQLGLMFGLTCAGCHTGMMEYKGQAFLIDGGAPLADLKRFIHDTFETLGMTRRNLAVLPDGTILPDEQKFTRFAQKIWNKETPSQEEIKTLGEMVDTILFKVQKTEPPTEEEKKRIYPLAWGYGRLDAFGRGGNTLLTPLSLKNFWPADAPVSFPALWGAYNYMWVQWNGSINQPMARNISQAITGSRRMEYDDPADPYKSDIDVKILHKLEQLMMKLEPPRWPWGRFEKAEDNKAFEIDLAKAAKGKILFNKRCAGCHVPSPEDGKKFLNLKVIPLNVIGTDSAHVTKFADRQVDTDRLGKGTIRANDFMKLATTEIRNRQYVEQNIPKEKYDEMDGFRENNWAAEKCGSTKDGKEKVCSPGYIARPLAGIWATAPFLHNGSVPNLYELLSPVSERSKCFYVGEHRFDPKRVGYALNAKCEDSPPPDGPNGLDERAYYDTNGFKFFTSIDGNKNTGHEFSDSGEDEFKGSFDDPQRMAIIEYLKTCDLQDPQDGTARDKIWWEENKDKRPIVCTDKYAATAK